MTSLIPFQPCSSVWISGQTGSGKTRWVYQFLRHVNDMYGSDPPEHILYCFGIYQPLFDEMERTIPHFTCQRGLPSEDQLEDFTRDRRHRMIIVDDLMHEVVRNQNMELLFTQGCHHRKISVIFITQNLFPKGKHARTIALNTWYLVLMKNPRDVSQVAVLGRQLFPGKTQGFIKAYEDAVGADFGYLVIDNSPRGNEQHRLRTRVLPGEEPIVYVLK